MKSPGFTFYPKDWLCSDTVRTLHRMGGRGVNGYMFLLCESWLQDPPGTLPNDEELLLEMSRLKKSEWEEFWPIMKPNFPLNGRGKLANKRLVDHHELQKKRAFAGKKGGSS